jgi:target of rapamycin complex subunit LST8
MAIKTGAIKPDPQTTQQPQIQQQQQQQQLKQNPESHSVILVTAGYDNTIRFWEALSGICSRTIQHPNSVGNSTKLFVNNPN